MTSAGKMFLERRVGPCRMLDILMAVVLLVILAIGVILIVTLTPMASRVLPKPEDGDCIDVAVIGAGIGGSYAGWRLKDKNLSVSVFEYSDRIGGRTYSKPLDVAPGTYLEFAAMRFREKANPILFRTATELGLKIIPFPLGHGIPDETLWYMRGTHMRNTDLGTDKMPYNIKPEEMKGSSALLWDLYKNNVNFSGDTYPSMEELYSLTTSDGTPVYQMSYDNFFHRYASREAYKFIFETKSWDEALIHIGALRSPRVIISYPGDTGGPSEGYLTVEGGLMKLPETLVEKFTEASENNKLHLNHQLMAIERREGGGYHLRFRKTETTDGITTPVKSGNNEVKVCAKKVILAVPRGCVVDIDFPVFRNNPHIMENINSVHEMPGGRIFLAYESKWWKVNNSDITHTLSDLPNLQTYDWQTGTNNVSIIMASYNYGTRVAHWRELSRFGTPIPGSMPGLNAVTDVVKERVEQYMSEIYGYKLEDIPEPVGGGMMLWDSYPFYAAWGYYKPGVDERKVNKMIQNPSPSDHVYICSNSWGEPKFQGWSEGSLKMVDEVIKKYFDN